VNPQSPVLYDATDVPVPGVTFKQHNATVEFVTLYVPEAQLKKHLAVLVCEGSVPAEADAFVSLTESVLVQLNVHSPLVE